MSAYFHRTFDSAASSVTSVILFNPVSVVLEVSTISLYLLFSSINLSSNFFELQLRQMLHFKTNEMLFVTCFTGLLNSGNRITKGRVSDERRNTPNTVFRSENEGKFVKSCYLPCFSTVKRRFRLQREILENRTSSTIRRCTFYSEFSPRFDEDTRARCAPFLFNQVQR